MRQLWKDIEGFPGYEVSNFGRVRSHGEYLEGEFFEGYRRIELQTRYGGRRRVRIFVHRLVLEAFVGLCPVGCIPHHKNGNKSDNELSNLEWITVSDHQRIAYAEGSRYSKGKFHSQVKLKEEDVLEIRKLIAEGARQASVARAFNTTPQNVFRITSRRTWTHI